MKSTESPRGFFSKIGSRASLPLAPSRGLGQNFLLDPDILAHIVGLCGAFEGLSVVEIGAGLGTLTQALLTTNLHQLVAIEKDARCMPFLSKLEQQDKRLSLIQGDIMALNPWDIGPQPRRALGNLPYALSVPLILRCAQNALNFESLVFTVQREVALRLIAVPGSPFYGRLSVMVQAYMTVTECWVMPPEMFTPSPKVYSSLIRLVPRLTPLQASWDHLTQVTQWLFSAPRKTLRHVVKKHFSEEAWQKANLPTNCRPGDLTLEQIGKVVNLYAADLTKECTH